MDKGGGGDEMEGSAIVFSKPILFLTRPFDNSTEIDVIEEDEEITEEKLYEKYIEETNVYLVSLLDLMHSIRYGIGRYSSSGPLMMALAFSRASASAKSHLVKRIRSAHEI